MIDVGDPAPDFTLADQDGSEVTLSDLRGRWALVYFYPTADTPGCTKQACGVRDHRADYEAANAVVLGVSPDSVGALRKFADKYGLPFTLLSDPGGEVMRRYFDGKERSSALVDPDGNVARVFRKVKPAQHDELVLGALEELS
jgi:peroxiredoxin Q/BCP